MILNGMPEPTKYKRDGLFTCLHPYDHFSTLDDFIEVTHWYNGEGFDVMISSKSGEQRFSLSWGEYNALLRLVPPDLSDD